MKKNNTVELPVRIPLRGIPNPSISILTMTFLMVLAFFAWKANYQGRSTFGYIAGLFCFFPYTSDFFGEGTLFRGWHLAGKYSGIIHQSNLTPTPKITAAHQWLSVRGVLVEGGPGCAVRGGSEGVKMKNSRPNQRCTSVYRWVLWFVHVFPVKSHRLSQGFSKVLGG